MSPVESAAAQMVTGSRSSRIWQASFVKEQGRPYIDLDAGVFYRAWEGEIVAGNKCAPPIRLPARLLAHMRRWHAKGAKYVVEYHGKPADPKWAFRNLVDEVLGEAPKASSDTPCDRRRPHGSCRQLPTSGRRLA